MACRCAGVHVGIVLRLRRRNCGRARCGPHRRHRGRQVRTRDTDGETWRDGNVDQQGPVSAHRYGTGRLRLARYPAEALVVIHGAQGRRVRLYLHAASEHEGDAKDRVRHPGLAILVALSACCALRPPKFRSGLPHSTFGSTGSHSPWRGIEPSRDQLSSLIRSRSRSWKETTLYNLSSCCPVQ